MRLTLRADPDEPKALTLAASTVVEYGGMSDTIAHWERLYQLLSSESVGVEQIATNLAVARTGQ